MANSVLVTVGRGRVLNLSRVPLSREAQVCYLLRRETVARDCPVVTLLSDSETQTLLFALLCVVIAMVVFPVDRLVRQWWRTIVGNASSSSPDFSSTVFTTPRIHPTMGRRFQPNSVR